ALFFLLVVWRFSTEILSRSATPSGVGIAFAMTGGIGWVQPQPPATICDPLRGRDWFSAMTGGIGWVQLQKPASFFDALRRCEEIVATAGVRPNEAVKKSPVPPARRRK